MKAVLAIGLLSVSASQAGEITFECGKNAGEGARSAEFALVLDRESPRGDRSGSDWAFYLSGKEQTQASLKVLKGPRHRPGVDGYELKIRSGSSPLSPRVVHSFSTCFQGSATLQKKSGAGTGREKPVGPEISCICQGI